MIMSFLKYKRINKSGSVTRKIVECHYCEDPDKPRHASKMFRCADENGQGKFLYKIIFIKG